MIENKIIRNMTNMKSKGDNASNVKVMAMSVLTDTIAHAKETINKAERMFYDMNVSDLDGVINMDVKFIEKHTGQMFEDAKKDYDGITPEVFVNMHYKHIVTELVFNLMAKAIKVTNEDGDVKYVTRDKLMSDTTLVTKHLSHMDSTKLDDYLINGGLEEDGEFEKV